MLTGILGCVEDKFDLQRLSTDMEVSPSFSAPLARGSITIDDLIGNEDSYVEYDSSGADPYLKIVYREDSLLSYTGDDFFDINESGSDGYTMGNISIPAFGPVKASVTFGQIVDQATTDTSTANTIESADGNSIPIPEISESDSMAIAGEYEADLIDQFRYAVIDSGSIELTLTNELPVQITAEFQLISQIMASSGDYVEDTVHLKHFEFKEVPAGAGQATQTMNLAGRKIGQVLYISELALSTKGSEGEAVPIDLDKQQLSLEASSSKLKVKSGEVALENEQYLDNKTTQVSTGYSGDRRLDTIRLRGGSIDYTITNSTDVSAQLHFRLPKTIDRDTDAPLTVTQNIPARSEIDESIELNNTQTLLNGADSIPVEYGLKLEASQEFVEYHASDQVDFNYTIRLSSQDADYISGYFGQETISFPREEFETGMSVFNKISGDFTFTDPSIRLFYTNNIGIPFQASLDLEAQSGSQTQNLNEGGADGLLSFNYPTLPDQPVNDTIIIDKTNSAVEDFISLPPENISFQGQGTINPNDDPTRRNFLSNPPTVQMGMEMALPLKIETSGVTYRDTFAFDVEEINFEEQVKLFGQFTNEFPFSVDLKLICRDSTTHQDLLELEAVDENNQPVNLLEAPKVDQSGKVTAPSQTTVYFNIAASDIEQFNQTNQLVIRASIATPGDGGVTFYTDYSLDFRIGISETSTQLDL